MMEALVMAVVMVVSTVGPVSAEDGGPSPVTSPGAPVVWVGRRIRTLREEMRRFDDYLVTAIDFFGGEEEEGSCRMSCPSGAQPRSRSGNRTLPATGCSALLLGLNVNVGVPSLLRCCNEHSLCYRRCLEPKRECDESLTACVAQLCHGLRNTAGITRSHGGVCESPLSSLVRGFLSLSCKAYLDRQREACFCPSEEKEEL